MGWKQCNFNPLGKQVGDCTVRAVAKATDQTWEDAYSGIAFQGFLMCDMPSANNVWGAYLKRKGFRRRMIPDSCPDCYTVEDFCRDHPIGTFIVALHGHVIAVKDGDYYDTWQSGNETPLYYFEREE
jgi:hypothetical protein